ncbi:DNA-binding transcriptional regulator Fis, partial [Oceanospirillum sp. HFRX-1_2]
MTALTNKNMNNMDISENTPEMISQAETNPRTLRSSVEEAMSNYFAHLDGQPVTNLYQMVL